MRIEFELIADSYAAAKRQEFTQSPTADFVRVDAAEAVRVALGTMVRGLTVKASAGKGQWADSPWIAVLDPIVTDSPQHGYYLVYLFCGSTKQIALSLNQGITEFRDTMSAPQAKEHLRHTAALIRLRVPEYASPGFGFFSDAIDLDSPPSASRSSYYEAGHSFGVTYGIPLPPQAQLESDLRHMVKLYRTLTFRGGVTEDFSESPDHDEEEAG